MILKNDGMSVYPRIMSCVLYMGWMVGGRSRMMPINCRYVYPRIMSCVLCMGWMVGGGSRNDARQDMKGTR